MDLTTLAFPRHLHKGPGRSVIVSSVAEAQAAILCGYTVEYDENRVEEVKSEDGDLGDLPKIAVTVPDEPSVPMPKPRGRPKKT